MGKLGEFAINFNTNRQVFYPGEQLSGHVVVSFNKPMKMRGLRVAFEGKAYCHWRETHGAGEDKHTEHYSGHEKIFDHVSCLFGSLSNSGSSEIMHPAGRFVYQFVFSLPPVLPSSFEASHGHIRYELKAQIDKPWKIDHKVKRPVIINEIIDPNNMQYAQGPGGEVHKEVGCLCCLAGPLDVTASIDRGAYCPGEIILINAQVQNHTSRDMSALKAKLIRQIEYHAATKTKREEKVVGTIDGPPIPKGDFATWANQAFGIPATSPTISSSRVITVNYMLKVQVDVPYGFDPSVNMPIVMGTVPYRATYGQPMAYGLPQEQQQNLPPTGSLPPMAPPPTNLFGYPDMAPPSYAAAVGENAVTIQDEDDKHTRGNLSYLPVYTFAQPYQGPVPPEYVPPESSMQPSTNPHYQTGLPPQQGGYPPQQGRFPPQQGGFPPQQGGYTAPNAPYPI